MSEMCSQSEKCAVQVNSYFLHQTLENTNKRRNRKFDVFAFIYCEVAHNFLTAYSQVH